MGSASTLLSLSVPVAGRCDETALPKAFTAPSVTCSHSLPFLVGLHCLFGALSFFLLALNYRIFYSACISIFPPCCRSRPTYPGAWPMSSVPSVAAEPIDLDASGSEKQGDGDSDVAMPSPSAAGADGQTLLTWIEEIVKPSMLSRMTSCKRYRTWLVQCRQSTCRRHCGSRTSCFKTLHVRTLSAQVCFVSESAPAQDKSDVGNHPSPLLPT